MAEQTGYEIIRTRQGLEQASAIILGRMIFVFSSLDMNLGLMLVWAHEGSQLKELTKRVSGYTFYNKIIFLAELAQSKYQSNREALEAYDKWLSEAHQVRASRNDLIHGRWGIDSTKNEVVNIVGLPTGEQKTARYKVSDLKAALSEWQQLEENLSLLRNRYPV